MNPLRRLNFRRKLNLGITLIVLFVAALLSVFVTRIAANALIEESKRRGAVLASNLALRAADPMLSTDFLRLRNLVDEVLNVDSDIVYAFIVDDRDQVLAHTFGRTFPLDLLETNKAEDGHLAVRLLDTGRERIYDFAAPVMVGGREFGAVRIGLSRTKVLDVVNGMILAISGLSVVALLVAVVISAHFAKRITARIGALKVHAEEIVRGNLHLPATTSLRRNCWEQRLCGRTDCPAYGDTERRCWYVKGTACAGCDGRAYPAKLAQCRQCEVYETFAGDEIEELADTFDVMAHALRAHIADLRETERDLTRQQGIMRTILEVTPDRMALLDEHLRYLSVNKAFADWLGLPPSGIIGKNDFELFPRDTAEMRVAENRAVLTTGMPVYREAQDRRDVLNQSGGDSGGDSGGGNGSGAGSDAAADFGHGRDEWFHLVKVPVFDEGGRIIGVLSTARDITAIRSYQDQLIQSQKMESVGKLAGGVAHEINTPLGIILGYAQLLQEDVPAESQMHQDLQIIEKQAKFCRKIVSDLLGFSRQTQSQKKEMCFNNSIMEVVSLVRHTFSLENVTILADLDDRLPVIYGAPEKLKQVWMNLLHNASGAMPGGGLIKVRTRLDIVNMTVTAWFADTGIGIPEPNLQQIFDPFFSTKPVGKGTGLGLSVSFGIIEDHEGFIEAHSPLPPGFIDEDMPQGAVRGPGSVFRVVLPLEPQGAADLPDIDPREKVQPEDPAENAKERTGEGTL